MRIKIAENIKKFRIASGYTQSELAILLSVSPQAVSRWENGQAFPDITLLPLLAKYLNVTIDEIMGSEEQRGECLKKEAFERNREYPVYFSKRVNLAVADGGYIESHSDMLERLDYEVELAVVIGKDAKNVKREQAWEYVFGYTVLNDVSAREIQTRHKQWYFGKSLENFYILF